MPSFFHLGRLHLPVFGICAAMGLMATLVLSQVTARRARLNPDDLWDALIAIAITALVISRALLVAGGFRFFLEQPMLVLTLPTVNDTGLLLTAIFAVIYLRWKQVPLLGFLDATAACGALLWSFLSLGRLFEGTRDGMPTHAGGVQPVELYTVLAAALLCAGLLQAMRLPSPAGRVFAIGLIGAGTTAFLLDLLRVPMAFDAAGILDPVQWLGLAMIVVGSALVIALPAATKIGSADAV